MAEEFEIPAGMTFTEQSAPVEQQSTETPVAEPEVPLVEESTEVTETTEAEPTKVPDAEKQANDLALARIQDKIRADNAEKQLQQMQPAEKPLGPEPVIGDYDTLENFLKDYKTWAKQEGSQEQQFKSTQQTQAQKQQETRAKVAVQGEVIRAKYADFNQTVQPLAGVIGSIPVFNSYIQKDPAMGLEVAYHLAKNPAMLEQLTRLDAIDGGRQLLALEAKLKTIPVVKQTSAPAPIKPVGSREALKPRLADMATKDPTAYIEKRNKEELARKRLN